jgi:acetyl esterase/lipase
MPVTNHELSRLARAILLSLFVGSIGVADAQGRIEKDAIYGVWSGLSLAMDVYYPDQPNRRGVLLVSGSAWDGREQGYTEYQLKAGYPYVNELRDALVRSNFTVFVPNTRMSPEFRYPAPIDDVRRAVRFIRYNASRFGIDPFPLAAAGHSSGGYLATMAGVLNDDATLSDSPYAAERESSRVQAVVAIDAMQDMTINTSILMPFTVAYMGERPPMDESFSSYVREGIYADASTVTHVTPDDAALLLIHADQDPNVSPEHMTLMEQVATEQGLDVEAILIESDRHSPPLEHRVIVDWLEKQLL